TKGQSLERAPIGVRAVLRSGLAQEVALHGRKNRCCASELVFDGHELDDPLEASAPHALTNAVIAPSAAIATPTYRLSCTPRVSEPPRASTVVKTAPEMPMPRTMPTLRAVARTPAAMPWRWRGAAPMSALLFGETKMPMPRP